MTRQVDRVDDDRPVVLFGVERRNDLHLYRWAQFARTGDRVVYHRGALGTLPERLSVEGHKAARDGLAFLAHRPLGDGQYAFEATRISERTARVLSAYQDALRDHDARKAA